uniref:RNA binding motif protein 12Ba n=1 Tax=Doryrhamphus excisus TaxID=161450 RepID=UPI0025AEB86D|nr:RNA binding motif protein 12Ba [Doryrhamphus excisus]
MRSSVVRLKGLDKKAGAEDIRHFFQRFHIPSGGVYILGGTQREAFIAFASEKEAGRATRYTGRPLKGSKVEIRRSDISELEHKLKYVLKRRNHSASKSSSKPTKTPEGTLAPSSVHPQHLCDGLSDPRTVLTLSLANSYSVSGFQTSDKSQDSLSSPPFVTGDCPQPQSPGISPPLFPKPGSPKSVPCFVPSGCPKSLNDPYTCGTIAGGSPPQVCNKLHDPRCPKAPEDPRTGRTIPHCVAGGSPPQVCNKLHNPRCPKAPEDPRTGRTIPHCVAGGSPPQVCNKLHNPRFPKAPEDPRTGRTIPHCVAGGSPPQVCNKFHDPRFPKAPEDPRTGGSPPQVCNKLHDPRCPKSPDEPDHPRTNPPVVCSQHPSSESLHDAFFLGVFTALEQLQHRYGNEHQDILPGLDWQDPNMGKPPERRHQTAPPPPGYVRLSGPPPSTTKKDICTFFEGLKVQEVVANVKLQNRRVCLVKFRDVDDALAALGFNHRSMGAVCVEVRTATALMWSEALQECENAAVRRAKLKHGSLADAANHKRKRHFESENKLPASLKCNAPKKPRIKTPPAIKEYIVMVCNISVRTTKTELRDLLGYPHMANSKIQHLLDKNLSRTDTAFLIFNQKDDFERALKYDGFCMASNAINVSAVTREKMNQMMALNAKLSPEYGVVDPPESEDDSRGKRARNPETCLLAENLHANTKERRHTKHF